MSEDVKSANWRHIANEWADELCNAKVALNNVRDGIVSIDEAGADVQRGIDLCRKLQASAPDVNSSGLEPVGVFADVNRGTGQSQNWQQMVPESFDGAEYVHLYAIPPDAAAEIAKLRAEVGRLTKDRDEAVCRKVEIETVAASQVRRRDATIAQQAERIAEFEGDADEKDHRELLMSAQITCDSNRLAAQSAALAKAREALAELRNASQFRCNVELADEALAAIDALPTNLSESANRSGRDAVIDQCAECKSIAQSTAADCRKCDAASPAFTDAVNAFMKTAPSGKEETK